MIINLGLKALSEPCNMGVCDFSLLSGKNDCFHGSGIEYMGTVDSPLTSKLKCLSWEDAKNPFFKPDRFPSLKKNFCRNPGNFRNAPWCFTNEKVSDKSLCRVGCLDACYGKGGLCENFCGKNSYCCTGKDENNGNCPKEALALAKTSKIAMNYHVCFAPKLKWQRTD